MPLRKLLALSLVVSSIAFAESVSEESGGHSIKTSATTHILVTNRKNQDNPDQLNNLMSHENSLNVEYDAYRAGIDFSSRIPIGNNPDEKKQVNLEKKIISAEWETAELKIGDTHQELGRGIALALYRDDTFGFDNTLEGISAKYHPGTWEVGGFAGRINPLRAPVALNPQETTLKNRTMWLASASGKARLADTSLGAHYVLAYNQPNGVSYMDKVWNTVGISAAQENIFGEFDANLESNYLFGQTLIGGQPQETPRGVSSYASLTWAPEGWKFRLEGKDYRNYEFDFRRPPTLEEDVVETTNISDVSGVRLFAEKNIEGTQTFINGTVYNGYDRLESAPIHHLVWGGRFRPFDDKTEFEFKTGYREMPGHNNMFHVSMKTKVPTFKRQSVELELRKQRQNLKLNVLPLLDDRNIANLAYSFGDVTFLAGYEYVPSNDNEVGQNFVNVGARVVWGIMTARAFLGQTSGGTQCSGGICRVVPAFTGAMIDTVFAL